MLPLSYVPSLIKILPPELARDMSSGELRLLDLIYSMIREGYKKSKAKSGWQGICQPGEVWLSDKLLLHPKHVSRLITRLRARNLLTVYQRKSAQGKWAHNVYSLGSAAVRVLFDYLSRFINFNFKPGNIFGGEIKDLLLKILNSRDSVLSYVKRISSRVPNLGKTKGTLSNYSKPRVVTLTSGEKKYLTGSPKEIAQQYILLLRQGQLAF